MGAEVPVPHPLRTASSLALALALPAVLGACPSLEDPAPPFEFALLQGLAVLFTFGVLQDLLRRRRDLAADGGRFDPWIHVHVLYLGLQLALLSTMLASDPPSASAYGPGAGFGLAFTASAMLSLWGTLLMGIPIGLFRAGACRAVARSPRPAPDLPTLRIAKS